MGGKYRNEFKRYSDTSESFKVCNWYLRRRKNESEIETDSGWEFSTYGRDYQTTNLVNPVISAGKIFHEENNTLHSIRKV